jgi:HEAT repeat protein
LRGAEPQDALRALLADPDRGVRFAAAEALDHAGAPPETLAPGLRDPEPCVRELAGDLLWRRGPTAVPTLLAALKDPLPEAREAAAWALRRGGVDAVAALSRRLDETDPRALAAVLDALRRLGSVEASVVEALIPLLAKPEPAVHDLAAALLIRADIDRARGAFEAAFPQGHPDRERWLGEVEAAVHAAGEARAKEEDAKRPPSEAKEPPPTPEDLERARGWVREADTLTSLLESADDLRALGEDPVPLMLAPLGSKDPSARRLATAALLAWSPLPASAGPAVERALGDDDVEVRRDVVLLVASLPEPRRFASRLEGLVASDDPRLRAAALHSLARIGALREDLRTRALADPDLLVRSVARRAGPPAPPPVPATPSEAEVRSPVWRVRRDAAHALGRLRTGAEVLAPLLADDVVAVADAAEKALGHAGTGAAVPVARSLADGHEGVLERAPRVFTVLGSHGAPAVPTLIEALAHRNVNVRETAARCLEGVGPGAAAAAPALVNALSDRRLCVVVRAALALVAIGAREPLTPALASARPRVRAYAAWVLGWNLGRARGLEGPTHEPRLPVLEPEAHGMIPVLAGRLAEERRAALAALSGQSWHRLDAEGAERAVEWALPDAWRAGTAVDFDWLRAFLASSELPAAVEYLLRARRTELPRTYVFGHLHRLPRGENLPALYRFAREGDPEAREGMGDLWQPAGTTTRYTGLLCEELTGKRLPDDGGRGLSPALRAIVEHITTDPEGFLGRDVAWRLLEASPEPADASLLLRAARLALEGDVKHVESGAAAGYVLALGALSDAESAGFLRRTAPWGGASGEAALAALTRRGWPDAAERLVQAAREDEAPLALLCDVDPPLAREHLAARLSDPDDVEKAARLLGSPLAGVAAGARYREEAFLGLEQVLLRAALPPLGKLRAAIRIPGARTRRLAEHCLAAFQEEDWERLLGLKGPTEDGGSTWEDELAFLHAAAPAALLERLDGVQAGDGNAPLRAAAGQIVTHLRDGPRLWEKPPPGIAGVVPSEAQTATALEPIAAGQVEDTTIALAELALAGHRTARWEYWSALRAGRYRWINAHIGDVRSLSLGWDQATFPHWIEDVDSNCCRVSGELEDLFETAVGAEECYSPPHNGLGEPRSRFLRSELERLGGAFVWAPIFRLSDDVEDRGAPDGRYVGVDDPTPP